MVKSRLKKPKLRVSRNPNKVKPYKVTGVLGKSKRFQNKSTAKRVFNASKKVYSRRKARANKTK